MRLGRLLSAVLAILLVLPSGGIAAPVETPQTILSENFTSSTPTQYTTEKLSLDNFATGVKWWGRVVTTGSTGALWCAGSPPPAPTSTTFPYAEGTSGKATFTVPQLADYYSSQLRFSYLLPTRGDADAASFSVHSRPQGLPGQQNHNRSQFPIVSAWTQVTHDLSIAGDYPISRQSGQIWFQWVDRNEAPNAIKRTGRGASIDDVVITGWKYGPVRELTATPVGRAVRLSWSAPQASVDTSAVDTRAVVYDVQRRPTSGSTWTIVASGTASREITVTGLAAATGYTFAVQARDAQASGFGQHVTASATTGVNTPPVAGADAYQANEDAPLVVTAPGVLGNDADPDDPTLTASAVTAPPAHGSVSLNANGSFTYTPQADYTGPDAFTYRVSDPSGGSATAVVAITVNAVNDSPVATPDAATIAEDTTLTVAAPGLLGNDTDVDHDILTAERVAGPAHGTLTLQANGSYVYRPERDWHGVDTFSYRAADATAKSAPTTVTVTVTPVNDAPLAHDDFHGVSNSTALAVSAPGVLINDTDVDGDALSAQKRSDPQFGSLELNSDGSFVYHPGPGFASVDSFTYRVSDGLLSSADVTVVLTAIDSKPVSAPDDYATTEDMPLTVASPGVLGNDVDADIGDALKAVPAVLPLHGVLSLSADGSFTYVPAKDYHGSDRFSYRAFDNASYSDTTTVNIEVSPVNDAPLAVNDGYTMSSVGITVPALGVLGNDGDVDGDVLFAEVVAQPSHGTLALDSSGAFTYVPNAGFFGADSFTYRAKDGAGASSNVATVALTVLPSGGVVTRIAGNDRFSVAEGLARRGWDPDGTKAWPGVTDVIIANGENGKEADPLAAAGLAGAYNAPVLLLQSARLPVSTKRALTEIAAKNPGVRVHVIGGTVTVPPARWTEIKAIPGVSKTDYRIAGKDRYDVTALIAQRMVSKLGTGAGGVAGALIVNAENPAAFYDALAVSPQAYAGRWALLGVRAGSVPPTVASVLKGSLAGKPRHVVNATTYVNASVYSAVGATGRYAKTTDRFTAATQIAARVDAESACSPSNVGVAAMLPDALTGGVFLGKRAGVLLFTDSSTALRPVTKTYITTHASEIRQGWVLGGTTSVPAAQATTFGNLID